MTVTATAPVTLVESEVIHNPFTCSLARGFYLSEEETERVVAKMRDSFPFQMPCELIVPPRTKTPSTKGLEPEERARVRAEVDEANAARRRRIAEFFSFLGDDIAQLLAGKVRQEITGFVIRRCRGDNLYTLIPEH